MMFSYRRQRWPGTMPLAVKSWSVSCCRAPWKLTNGCIQSEPIDTCGLCKWLRMRLQISLLLTSSCAESADGYRHVIFGRRSNPTGPWSRREYGPSMLRDFRTKRYTGASFSKSIQKSLVGLKILTRDQMHTGSGSSGNVVEHGLRNKLLRSFRTNGSALAMDWLPWAHSSTSMAHKAGSIPTQTWEMNPWGALPPLNRGPYQEAWLKRLSSSMQQTQAAPRLLFSLHT